MMLSSTCTTIRLSLIRPNIGLLVPSPLTRRKRERSQTTIYRLETVRQSTKQGSRLRQKLIGSLITSPQTIVVDFL
jgi:hypothetical protein